MNEIVCRDFEQYVADLPAGLVSCTELFPPHLSFQTPPAFLLGTIPVELSLPIISEFGTGPVRLYTLRDGAMTVDGIVIHGNTALSSNMFNHPDYHVASVIQAVHGDRLSLPVRRVEERAVMLSGPGYNIYGHWLADILPRLWVLASCGLDPSKLRYIVPAQSPPFLLKLLETFGITGHQLILYDERAEVLQVAELLLPTNLRRASRMHSGLGQARDYLIGRARAVATLPPAPTQARRVFVSRRKADPSRSLENRDRVERLAMEYGYEVVFPEEMSVAEQIALFRNVSCVMGEYGSGLHNTLFSAPGTVVCAMRGTSAHPGFIQSGIGHVCRHYTGYVFGQTPIAAIHQSFAVEEELVRVALSSMELLSQPDSLRR